MFTGISIDIHRQYFTFVRTIVAADSTAVSKYHEHLLLCDSLLSIAGVQKLAGGIANTKTLRDLNLSMCKIKNYGASFLASAFAVNKSLHTIVLQGNPCGGNQSTKRLAFALMRSQRLRHLYLGETNIGEGIDHFARFIETTRTLKTLDLSYNNISDEGAVSIGNAMMVNRSITSLCLKHNKIADEGLKSLAAGLVTNSFLVSLDVGGNTVGDEGFAKLCTVLSTNDNLLELDIGDNQIGVDSAIVAADMLRSNTALCTLNLSDNPIQYRGVMRVADALRINETLQVCYVGVDSLGAEGMQELTNNDAVEAFWSTRLVVI